MSSFALPHSQWCSFLFSLHAYGPTWDPPMWFTGWDLFWLSLMLILVPLDVSHAISLCHGAYWLEAGYLSINEE